MKKLSKFKKIVITALILITLIFLTGLGFAGNYLYNLALNPHESKDMIFDSTENEENVVLMNSTSGPVNIESEKWLLEHSNYEDLFMSSNDGLNLYNYLINNNDSNKWVITVHGYTSEGKNTASYAKNFYDMGYNVIIPDLRGHGKSEGDYIGMGWDERHDIIDLVDYIVEKDSNAEIVLYGISMGAATVMNVSGEELPSNVKAVIEDCGYTNVWDEFSHQLKALFNLPPFPLMNVASIFGKINAGYWISDASPIDQISKSITPTLFIHGDNDDFVPFSMLDDLYNASTTEKEKLVIPGAGHAKASKINPKLYWETINNFLNKYIN